MQVILIAHEKIYAVHQQSQGNLLRVPDSVNSVDEDEDDDDDDDDGDGDRRPIMITTTTTEIMA